MCSTIVSTSCRSIQCVYLVKRQGETSVNVQPMEDSDANHSSNKVEIG